MQVRLPVIVVGGGLTAIDTATESLAYYPVQVEKFLQRYETLVAEIRAWRRWKPTWTAPERAIAHEFLAHARALRAERDAAQREGRAPQAIAELLQRWGGVTIVVSPPPDRQPVVHAEPRGSREGAGGGHPVRRRSDAARHRSRRAMARAAGLKVSLQHNDGDGVWHETARTVATGAHDIDRGRHAAQHRARARGRRALPPRRQIFPRCSMRTASRAKVHSRSGQARRSPPC